jgi:hypothetical protein
MDESENPEPLEPPPFPPPLPEQLMADVNAMEETSASEMILADLVMGLPLTSWLGRRFRL